MATAPSDDAAWDPPYRVGNSAVAWTLEGAIENRKNIERACGVRVNIFDRETGEVITRSMVDRYRRRDEQLGHPTKEQIEAWYEERARAYRRGS